MAATDENWWIKRFVSVCNQFPNDAIQAAQAAATIHSGYLPSMLGDHLEDFVAGPGADYLPGPYTSRQESPWLPGSARTNAQQQRESHQQRVTAAAEEVAGVPPPPTWEASTRPDGRLKTAQGIAFCWAYCATKNCNTPCPNERALNWEFWLATHPTVDCRKKPAKFIHPQAKVAAIAGKSKGRGNGKGKGKGKKGKDGRPIF